MTPTITLTTDLCAVCLCHDVTTAPRIILPTVGSDEPDAVSLPTVPVMVCDGCLGVTS